MTAFTNDSPKGKKVPVQERSFTMGKFVGINGYRINHSLLKQRFAEGGYQLHETPHFLIFTRPEAPSLIVVHWFAPEEIDANIGDYFVQELKPAGILVDEQDFGNLFGAIVFSLFPHDTQHALHLYGTNTLRRYQYLLHMPHQIYQICQKMSCQFHNQQFIRLPRLYRRVCQLHGRPDIPRCWLLLWFFTIAHFRTLSILTHILGVDIQTGPFPIVSAIAAEHHLQNINFEQADVLTDTFSTLGHFDTVVALHVLEHLTEADMYRALLNLLK